MTLECAEIRCGGTVHYRRPMGHAEVAECAALAARQRAQGWEPECEEWRCGAEFDGETVEESRYRYAQWRVWDEAMPALVVIGLNPSTATHEVLDPTVRKCVKLAQREGCGGLWMLNLFPWRDTSPAKMKAAAEPVGDLLRANAVLRERAAVAKRVLCAWGRHGSHRGRAAAVLELLAGRDLFCLVVNGDGSPQHPLYVPDAAPLLRYAVPGAAPTLQKEGRAA